MSSLLKHNFGMTVEGKAFDAGTTVPSGLTGWTPGCILVHTDGSGATSLYKNEGAFASCNFVAMLSGSGASLTLDEAFDNGKVIDGASSAANSFAVGDGTDGIRLFRNAANDVRITTLSGDSANLTIAPDGGATTITGTLALSGNLAIASNKFTVAATSGNTVVAGTLGITGATTAAAITADSLTGTAAGDFAVAAPSGQKLSLDAGTTGTTDIATTSTGNVTIGNGSVTQIGLTAATVAVTGDMTVSGGLTFGGNWTVADTLTVDELILDTEGSQPSAGNCDLVRDNTGDLTANAITGKEVHIAIDNADEYDYSATVLDLNGNALDNAGFIILNTATAPGAGEVYAVHDNSGDLTLNAKSGQAVHIAVAGADEFNFTAAALEVASGNDIQFLGNDGILDSAGNEVLLVEAIGSAINYLNIKNAATADPIILECLGTADRGFIFANDQDEEILILTPVATAVNELTVLNAVSAGQPIIRTSGEADIGLEIQNAAGEVMLETLSTSDPLNWLSVSSTNTGNPVILLNPGQDDIGFSFQAKNAEEILNLAATTDAINEITITSKAAGNGPVVEATGGDTHIDLVLTPKGTGLVQVSANGIDMATNPVYGGTGADENLILHSTEHGTKGYVAIPDTHEGLKVGGTAVHTTPGTNTINIFNGTPPVGTIANGASLYTAAGELTAIDFEGNTTVLSPHNEAGDFIIKSYSARKDSTLNVNLEQLLRKLVTIHPELAPYLEDIEGQS